MKKMILVALISLVGFTSCSKEEVVQQDCDCDRVITVGEPLQWNIGGTTYISTYGPLVLKNDCTGDIINSTYDHQVPPGRPDVGDCW